MDPTFVQNLHNLLLQSTTNDTIQLKAATAQLNKEFYKDPACIPALANIIANSQEIPVRQLAAIELRKRVSVNSGNLWLQVSQADREQLKTQLPEIVLRESNSLVRHSTARVIAAIAGIEIPVGGWPQLLPFLHETATSSQSTHREVGIYILYTVLETIVEGFQEHLQSFFKLFERLLQDPESAEVRVTTVRSLGTVAQYIDTDDKTDIKSFQNLLPLMIQVLAQTLEAGDEANARHLFDVFETLLILEIPLLSQHIPQLVQFFIQAGCNRSIDSELRILALNALNWTVQYKKSKIQSNSLAAAILDGLMPITTEEEPEDIDDDAPARSALRIIDTLATSLPPTQVFPALRAQIQQYFSSTDSSHRRGAMLALGVSVEGCSEYMTPLMSQVWPVIEAGLQDSDPGVRRATCVAVSCLCEWLEDECVSRHAVLVPAIMALVADPATQRSACTALDALLEVLHDVIDQYLPLIMERLSGLLETAPLNVKAVVTGAIGSAAHASKDQFTPYFQETMHRMQHFLVLTGEGEEIELRGITMDTVGTFAEAVGKDLFRPYYEPLMKQAFQGIELASARLRECSFLFFGVMASVFGEEFSPSLPAVVPSLIASLKQEENGQELQPLTVSDVSAFASGSSPANAISVEDGTAGAEEVDIDLDKALDVNSAVAVEKEIAADTLGTLFASTREHFLPFVEQTALELIGLLPHYYEGIRKSSTDSLLKIIRTFYDLSGQPEWQPGANVQHPLNQNVKDLIDRALPELLDMYDGEDNKGVVSTLCVGLAETINKIGPALLEQYYDRLCSMAKEILEQKAICQQDPDQDADEEAPEDQAEYDSVLISSAGDLVAAMANALGADFAQAFNTFYPLIAKYYKKSRSLSDRSSAIGCLAEIISGIKGAITPSTEPLLELLWRAISDPDAEVQSNAAFATGLLVENSEQDLSPQYIALLGALQPLFNLPADAPAPRLNARDNACGAVARLILRNASAVPLAQVLPVLFAALPLQNDLLENRPVFRAVLYLSQTQPDVLSQYLDGLLRVFAQVLDPSGPDQIGDEVRAGLIGLIGALNARSPEKVQQAGLGAFVPGA
ncbi:ARM repeat-containing protein [Multifurca ochricompacta]|uniref:ARM repeat-containing protein n=1 Tax=Multifurca ochricompacta TaxID=376703 RepID=A0AAD4M1P1_9AGAM|nr:ARM repeat-containing protein [Multifurca ochricompacta]